MKTLALDEVLDLIIDHRGKTPKKLGSDFAEQGVPVASALLVYGGRLHLEDARFVPTEVADRWMPDRLRAGDVLVTSEAPLGRVAWVEDDSPLVLGQRLFALRPRPGILESRYLGYWLMSTAGQGALRSQQTGSTVAGIRQSALRTIRVPVPNIETQRHIGEILGALDDKIAANTAVIDGLRQLMQAHWTSACSSSRSYEGTLADLAEINPRTKVVQDGAVPFLDMKNLPECGFVVSEWSTRETASGTRFRDGDTLMARITPCFENRKMALVDFLGPDTTGAGSTEYIVFRAKDGVPAAVPYLVTSTDDFHAFASKYRTGTSGRQRVQAAELAGYAVQIPEAETLQRLGLLADACLAQAGTARDENTTLAATRDELLPLLMSGKITVKDAEKRVEEEI